MYECVFKGRSHTLSDFGCDEDLVDFVREEGGTSVSSMTCSFTPTPQNRDPRKRFQTKTQKKLLNMN